MKLHKLFAVLAAGMLSATQVPAQSTIATNLNNCWGGNIGWLDFRAERPNPGDGVRVKDTILAGYVWAADIGWIHLGDGTPSNAIRYANADNVDYGVNVDRDGNLSGLAWAPNIGWINFGWAANTNAYRPRVNIYNGYFFGCAWSTTCGWINLGNSRLKTDSIAITDTDVDGLSDAWERDQAGDLLTLTANGDADHDGMTDKAEYLAGTDPVDANSVLCITALAVTPATATLTWASVPSRQYQVSERTNLTAGAWALSQSGNIYFADPGATSTGLVNNTNGPQRFYRVSVLPFLVP